MPYVQRPLDAVTVADENGCIRYLGHHDRDGYAQRRGKHSRRIARNEYIEAHGDIGELVIDHLCRNRWCVNVEHLEPVPNRENVMRGRLGNAGKTHCPQGHAYDKANTRVSSNPNGRPMRKCRACDRERYHRRKAS